MFSFSRNAVVAACVLSVLGGSAWASLGSIDSEDINVNGSAIAPLAPVQAKAGSEVGSVIALNQAMSLGNIVYPAGTEMIVGENNELFVMSDDGSDEPLPTGGSLNMLSEKEYTVVPVNPVTGELQEYNIPSDFEVAGRAGHHSRRGGHARGRGRNHGRIARGGHHHGGVTNCYHVAKAVLARRIHLTGIPAYTAAPQLRAAGWKRYDYADAPNGSACVFGAGGIRTPSGGATYGHIGIKGYGGVINVEVGFRLKRPFIGCFHEA